jgi:hypothetical protein
MNSSSKRKQRDDDGSTGWISTIKTDEEIRKSKATALEALEKRLAESRSGRVVPHASSSSASSSSRAESRSGRVVPHASSSSASSSSSKGPSHRAFGTPIDVNQPHPNRNRKTITSLLKPSSSSTSSSDVIDLTNDDNHYDKRDERETHDDKRDERETHDDAPAHRAKMNDDSPLPSQNEKEASAQGNDDVSKSVVWGKKELDPEAQWVDSLLVHDGHDQNSLYDIASKLKEDFDTTNSRHMAGFDAVTNHTRLTIIHYIGILSCLPPAFLTLFDAVKDWSDVTWEFVECIFTTCKVIYEGFVEVPGCTYMKAICHTKKQWVA